MAKSTVDLIRLLQYFSTEDSQAKITIWADGSYLLSDGENGDILNSDTHVEFPSPLKDIHGLLYENPAVIDRINREFPLEEEQQGSLSTAETIIMDDLNEPDKPLRTLKDYNNWFSKL